jgi:hypothetical protein
MDNSNKWGCEVQLNEQLFNKFVGRPLHSVTLLFQSRIRRMIADANMMSLEPTEIGACFRQLEWKLCRMQRIGAELAALKRRYKGALFVSEGNILLFEVEFADSSRSKSLLVTFEISDTYPFTPISFELGGEADIESIQGFLDKSAKPGFGYLSRTCEIISGYLQTEK